MFKYDEVSGYYIYYTKSEDAAYYEVCKFIDRVLEFPFSLDYHGDRYVSFPQWMNHQDISIFLSLLPKDQYLHHNDVLLSERIPDLFKEYSVLLSVLTIDVHQLTVLHAGKYAIVIPFLHYLRDLSDEEKGKQSNYMSYFITLKWFPELIRRAIKFAEIEGKEDYMKILQSALFSIEKGIDDDFTYDFSSRFLQMHINNYVFIRDTMTSSFENAVSAIYNISHYNSKKRFQYYFIKLLTAIVPMRETIPIFIDIIAFASTEPGLVNLAQFVTLVELIYGAPKMRRDLYVLERQERNNILIFTTSKQYEDPSDRTLKMIGEIYSVNPDYVRAMALLIDYGRYPVELFQDAVDNNTKISFILLLMRLLPGDLKFPNFVLEQEPEECLLFYIKIYIFFLQNEYINKPADVSLVPRGEEEMKEMNKNYEKYKQSREIIWGKDQSYFLNRLKILSFPDFYCWESKGIINDIKRVMPTPLEKLAYDFYK